MIAEWGMHAALGILDLIYTLAGALPSFSPEITNAVNTFFDFIFSAVGLISIFVDINMIKILVPIVIGIINLENIVRLVVFIIKKIPLINLK